MGKFRETKLRLDNVTPLFTVVTAGAVGGGAWLSVPGYWHLPHG